jgi:hypothetical protein
MSRVGLARTHSQQQAEPDPFAGVSDLASPLVRHGLNQRQPTPSLQRAAITVGKRVPLPSHPEDHKGASEGLSS